MLKFLKAVLQDDENSNFSIKLKTYISAFTCKKAFEIKGQFTYTKKEVKSAKKI